MTMVASIRGQLIDIEFSNERAVESALQEAGAWKEQLMQKLYELEAKLQCQPVVRSFKL